jgi:hypothetical protein
VKGPFDQGLRGSSEALDRRTHLRLVRRLTASQQGLRTPSGGQRGDGSNYRDPHAHSTRSVVTKQPFKPCSFHIRKIRRCLRLEILCFIHYETEGSIG